MIAISYALFWALIASGVALDFHVETSRIIDAITVSDHGADLEGWGQKGGKNA